MPIFDYHCNQCGHDEVDKLVRSSDTEVKCPHCGHTNTPMVTDPKKEGFVCGGCKQIYHV